MIWLRLGDRFVSQNTIGICVFLSPRQMLCSTYIICSYGQTSIFCTMPSESLCPLSRFYSHILSLLVCCIRLFCDWLFRLYHHITNICCFVACYLFLLWYYWFSWHCFKLLLQEIQFLSLGFLSYVHVFSCDMFLDSPWKRPESFLPSFQDSSQYSGRFQQSLSLDGLHSNSYFQVFQSLYQCFLWLYWERQLQMVSPSYSFPTVFVQFPSKVQVLIFLFDFFQFYFSVSRDRKVKFGKFSFSGAYQ